jgi:class 3 adenylate cyclase
MPANESSERIVLVSDICSSTKLLLDLQANMRVRFWGKFLTRYSDEVHPVLRRHNVETYKFQGDGWIYFLDPDLGYGDFVRLLRDLVAAFYRTFDPQVTRQLSFAADPKGLTFGADRGTLSAIMVDGVKEWVGRPLNVACRLQGAIKDPPPGAKALGHPYHNQALLSPLLDNRWNPADIPGQVKVHRVRRTLRNIAGSDYKDVPKLSLLGPFNPQPNPRLQRSALVRRR